MLEFVVVDASGTLSVCLSLCGGNVEGVDGGEGVNLRHGGEGVNLWDDGEGVFLWDSSNQRLSLWRRWRRGLRRRAMARIGTDECNAFWTVTGQFMEGDDVEGDMQ